MDAINLDSPQVTKLVDLIRNSFRIRENHDPVFVEVGDALRRLSGQQHQVIFGRRGSGKSCLFVHFMRGLEGSGDKAIYISVDAIKRLPFPDILTRILITLFEKLPTARRPWYLKFSRPSRVERTIVQLRALLDEATASDVERTDKTERKRKGKVGIDKVVALGLEGETANSNAVKQLYRREKLEYLERHLEDYKQTIKAVLPEGGQFLYVLVDDFYLVDKRIQPDVVDYLHRLLRDTNAYLKLGSIRHRTVLRRHENQTIGVELGQDVEEISLDRALNEFADTQHFLMSMLDKLAVKAGIDGLKDQIFNPDAAQALTLASAGVPRDFLTIFSDALGLAKADRKSSRITPTHVWKAAANYSLNNKRRNLSEDAGVDAAALETLFYDIVVFCLKEKKKTALLIDRDEAQKMQAENELLQQLMDFKLIHLIESDTSAASGREGRYSAYMLDGALFMEPRRRGIELVKFWEQDDQRRPIGMREAPTYPLGRAQKVVTGDKGGDVNLDDALKEDASEEPTD